MQLAASAALHDLCSFHRPNKVAYLHQLEQQFVAGNCDVGAKLLHTLPSSFLPVTRALCTTLLSLWINCTATARLWQSRSHKEETVLMWMPGPTAGCGLVVAVQPANSIEVDLHVPPLAPLMPRVQLALKRWMDGKPCCAVQCTHSLQLVAMCGASGFYAAGVAADG